MGKETYIVYIAGVGGEWYPIDILDIELSTGEDYYHERDKLVKRYEPLYPDHMVYAHSKDVLCAEGNREQLLETFPPKTASY